MSERLKLESTKLELDLGVLKLRFDRLEQLIEKSLATADDLDAVRADIAAQQAMIDEIHTRLDLRKRFVAGQVTAQELEIKDRTTVAESALRQAQSRVDSLKVRLERFQALETKGMISKTETQQVRYDLEAAQAELSLAALEIEVLGKVK